MRAWLLSVVLASTITFIPSTTTYVAPPEPEPKDPLKAFYDEAPVMEKVAWCESREKQSARRKNFTEDGRHWSTDVGLFQINDFYWKEKSEELGYDIYTKEGNIKMARWLYERHGTDPWEWSAGCWRF